MRREATTENNVIIPTLAGYHGGRFNNLNFYNSDRVIKLNPNYTVSSENSFSTLKIAKAGSSVSGYGIELETVCSSTSNRTVLTNMLTMVFDKLFPADLFKIEADCTVDAECVSQVMSKAFIRNNYKNFKSMFDNYFPAFGITTNDSRCGMHVNLSLSLFGNDEVKQIECARKLGYLINKHYDFFKVAVNREGSTRWCPRMRYEKEYWKNTDIYCFPISHSECCVNMGHLTQGRLELRLVGGQKNYACFRNTMEVVFQMIEAVKKLSWNDLDNLEKVFKGCNQHCYDRLTKCRTVGVLPQATLDKITATIKLVDWE